MTEIHQVKCDKCGKIKNMKLEMFNRYKLPLFWKNIKKNCLIDLDLCPKCIRLFKYHTKEFFK